MRPTSSDPSRPDPARCAGTILRFRRSDDGAFAIEFGFIAPLFLGLIFGILEVALTFWSTQILETAVANAARQIYTGSFQTSTAASTPAQQAAALAKFKDLVCANVAGVFDCQRRVSVDVQRFSGFSGTTLQPPVTNGVYDTSSYGYNPPGANEICVVRASLEYPVFVNLFGYSTGLRSGNRLIMASSAFKTEPYQ